jgi:hypothetical protein
VCTVTTLNYDSVGVGKGTQDALKRSKTTVATHGVNTGSPPTEDTWPDGEKSSQKFANLKAELWNKLRARFKKSWEKCRWLEGERDAESHDWPTDECIILPAERGGSDVATLCAQLSTVKNEANEAGKVIMQSKKSLKKDGIASPDHADALVLTEATTSQVETWMKAFGVQER